MGTALTSSGRILLCALLSLAGVFGATLKRLPGSQIFSQRCAKCHGHHGEGVKDQYDDPLFGDWSVTKLTGYIAKSMPDDDPETCTGPDADAVAHYIYDAFYSRAARARNHPARVELIRLTNRQYLNAVADLLKHFGPADPPLGAGRGLRAAYFNAADIRGGFNRQKIALERVDPQVDFDFGSGSPDPAHLGSGAFSMQWRGSVIAKETGDYEFIVQSPNAVRLWVNAGKGDPPVSAALIDAFVATGERRELRGVLHLIGGRAYPLGLDFWAYPPRAKDPVRTAGVSLQWIPPHGAREPIPARNLVPVAVAPTLVVTTPFPADDSSVGYERGVSISKDWDEATTEAAIEVAHYVLPNLDSLSHSRPGDADRTVKVETFCREFAATAFRRPLSREQERLYLTKQFKAAASLEQAVTRVVLLTLNSPRFLYLGLTNLQPDDFTAAARLSFELWDSLPDRELWAAAAGGRLHTREEVAAQAHRLLQDPRARAKMQYSLHHWLQMDSVDDLSKDPNLYPGFTPEVIADLRTSLDLFLDEVVWSESSSYRQLLLADYLYLNPRLARFYGRPEPPTADFVRTPFDPAQRSGIVTHPYLLSAFSYQRSSSPIHRGVFLTRNIVGRTLNPPPMAMTFNDSSFPANLTMRQKVAAMTRAPACQSCHSVINSLGFSLEQYDAVGRFRTTENGHPIDAISNYVADDGKVVRLNGARDLAAFAADSEAAQDSFIEQLFNQTVKQPMLAYGAGAMDQLRHSFVASDYNVRELLAEISSLAALRGIAAPPVPDKNPPGKS